jgi:hypothetical protein
MSLEYFVNLPNYENTVCGEHKTEQYGNAGNFTPEWDDLFCHSLHERNDIVTDIACAEHETDMEQRKNDTIFTSQMVDLFCLLSSWENASGTNLPATLSNIELTVDHGSLSDIYNYQKCKSTGNVRQRAYTWRERKHLCSRRYKHSYLRLRCPVGHNDNAKESECWGKCVLPEVYSITSLRILHNLRQFWPASICQLASRLPRLRSLDVFFVDKERIDAEIKWSMRSGELARNFALQFRASHESGKQC